jgi:protein ImuA
MGHESSAIRLETLRARIARIGGRLPHLHDGEGAGGDAGQARRWTTGHGVLDAALGGGLPMDGLIEVTPSGPAVLPSASAFAFMLLSRLPRRGVVLHAVTRAAAREHGVLHAPGLLDMGLDPGRVLAVEAPHPRDMAFILEEAAQAGGVAALLAEGPPPSFLASRRLSLLLARSGVPCLFVPDAALREGSAAALRLRVAPLAGPPARPDARGPAPPAFRVTLARLRGGPSGLTLDTVFHHGERSFAPFPRPAPAAPAARTFPAADDADRRRAG